MQHIDYTAHECSEESDQKEEKQTVLFPLFKVSLSVYFAQHHIPSYCCRFVGVYWVFLKSFHLLLEEKAVKSLNPRLGYRGNSAVSKSENPCC